LTTFTEKAAKNLQDRLSEAFLFLANMYPQLAAIDPSALRIGTLHGLCNDILQEYRYTAYQNLRLLDEVESSLLIHRQVANNIQALQEPSTLNSIIFLQQATAVSQQVGLGTRSSENSRSHHRRPD